MTEAIPYTISELVDIWKPHTWFRKELIERTNKEIRDNPKLGLELSANYEELRCKLQLHEEDFISERELEKVKKRVRRNIGNVLYH
tara:strand:- start:5740 stop:5997 length:258 start_codon:yes stop_codon:yes gene_type:complete